MDLKFGFWFYPRWFPQMTHNKGVIAATGIWYLWKDQLSSYHGSDGQINNSNILNTNPKTLTLLAYKPTTTATICLQARNPTITLSNPIKTIPLTP